MPGRDSGLTWGSPTLVSLPSRRTTPARELARRGLIALGLLGLVVAIVWFDRGSYTDNHDGSVTLIDAIYYATVTITTTGYGDITPIAPHARIINAILITPLRIAFLVLLISSTLELLALRGRQQFRAARWRKRMRDHIVVIGYGTKGRSAVETLRRHGVDAERVVVVDPDRTAGQDATSDGYAVVAGDATRRDNLRRAGVEDAEQVIITPGRDDSAEWFRTAYHDMSTADVEAGTGGLDASISFETDRAENKGPAFNATMRQLNLYISAKSSMEAGLGM